MNYDLKGRIFPNLFVKFNDLKVLCLHTYYKSDKINVLNNKET